MCSNSVAARLSGPHQSRTGETVKELADVGAVPPRRAIQKQFVSGAQPLPAQETPLLTWCEGPVQPEGSEEAPAKEGTTRSPEAARQGARQEGGDQGARQAATKAPAKEAVKDHEVTHAKKVTKAVRRRPRTKASRCVRRRPRRRQEKGAAAKRPATKA